MTDPVTPPGRGGRPKGDPAQLRAATIGVRVSETEYAADKARTLASMYALRRTV
jgi:hypothetical protein